MTKPSTSRLGPHFFVFDAKYYDAIIRQKTESCSRRILSIEDAHEGLAGNLWTKKERFDAVEGVHSALSAVSMGNGHSAVAGIGGTARASTKVAILLDLKLTFWTWTALALLHWLQPKLRRLIRP